MWKRIINAFLIIGTLVILCGTCWLYYLKIEAYNKVLANVKQINAKSNAIEKNLVSQIIFQNEKVIPSFLRDKNGQKFYFYDLVNVKDKGNIICLFGGTNYCGSCVEYFINSFLDYVDLFGSANMMIVFQNVLSRELFQFCDNFGIKNNIGVFSSDEEIFPIVNPLNAPYVIIINESLQILSPFFILKGEDNYNEKFYRILYETYFD